jgi:phenylacetate-coenzyme A ligase PaaK-like adenylate-forming protein
MKDHTFDSEKYLERCATALDQALNEVPAYRAWRQFDRGKGAPIDERYAGMPALTKRDMNIHTPAAFIPPGRSLAEGLRSGEIELVETSGTTEDKVTNVWYQPWWNASELASWTLNAHAARVTTGDQREAILANPLNVGFRSERGDLPMEKRRLDRFLFLNDLADPLAWTDSYCDRMLRELDLFQPVTLEANPSLLSRLCRYVLRTGKRAYQPPLIVLTYEYPSFIHRRQMAAVFDAPIMSSYGSTESGYVFIECEHGRFHQNVDYCRVDFLPFRDDCGGPDLGKLLVTTFGNPWRSLIRFDVGDLSRLEPEPCPCGRKAGMTLALIEGRTANLTITPGGMPVTQARVDRGLSAVSRIDNYELRQTDESSYRLRIVADSGFDPATAVQARGVLREIYGPKARISVEEARDLAPGPSGKFQLVQALFPLGLASFLDPRFRPPVPADSDAGGGT